MSSTRGNPNLIWRVVDGEAILLDTVTGYHFSLDPIGTDVWQSLQAGQSLDEIVSRIAKSYGTDEVTVRADVAELMSELQSANLWT